MIAKQTTAKAASVSNMIAYVLRENGLKHPEEKVRIIFQNALVGDSRDQLVDQIQLALDLNNHRCGQPLFHAMFSLSEAESLNADQELQLAAMIMKEFKLDNNMFLLCKHESPVSKEHYHAIIVRPPIDGTQVVNLFQSKKRLMAIARKCEQSFQLKQVPMPQTWTRNIDGSIKEKELWNDRQQQARLDLKTSLSGATSMLEFISRMQKAGYSLHKARGLGIVHKSSGIYFKASSLGLSLSKIEKIIAFNKKQQKTPLSLSELQQLERNIALADRNKGDGIDSSSYGSRMRIESKYLQDTSNKDGYVSAVHSVTLALIDYMMAPLRADVDAVYFGSIGMGESEKQKRLKEKRRIQLSL